MIFKKTNYLKRQEVAIPLNMKNTIRNNVILM